MLSRFDVLIGRFGGRLAVPIKEMAPLLGFSYSTFRNRLCDGRQEVVPTRLVGGNRMVVLTDLAVWLDGQKTPSVEGVEAHQSTEPSPLKRGRGRPRKVAPAVVAA